MLWNLIEKIRRRFALHDYENAYVVSMMLAGAAAVISLQSGHSRVTVGSQSGHSRVMVFTGILCCPIKEYILIYYDLLEENTEVLQKP